MEVTVVIGPLRTVIKRLIQGQEDLEFRGRVETIQTTTLLNRQKSWRFEDSCGHLDSSENPSANADVKNTQKRKNNYHEIFFENKLKSIEAF